MVVAEEIENRWVNWAFNGLVLGNFTFFTSITWLLEFIYGNRIQGKMLKIQVKNQTFLFLC